MGKSRKKKKRAETAKDSTQRMLAETHAMNARLLLLLQYQAERERRRCSGRSPTPRRDRPAAVLVPRKPGKDEKRRRDAPRPTRAHDDPERAYLRYMDEEFQKLMQSAMDAAQGGV